MKTALITGVTGQDGSFLSDFLLEKDYKVIGLYRRSSINKFDRIAHQLNNPNLELVEGDITDPTSVSGVISKYTPDECYNTAAMSHVHTSFEQPTYTSNVNYNGVQYILEGIRQHSPHTRLLQFSTSEMMGSNYSVRINENGFPEKYQDENTTFSPISPYAVSKLAAHHLVKNYRVAYNLHCSCAITYNHESERRGENFVTRKITKWIGQFYHNINLDPKLHLGNIDSYRDWGYAKDFCPAWWSILQQEEPDDYIISTGETHSVKEFLDLAFQEIGIDDWSPYVVIDQQFFRPSDVTFLKGDSTKAREKLGWTHRTSFSELVSLMVRNDINEAEKTQNQTANLYKAEATN